MSEPILSVAILFEDMEVFIRSLRDSLLKETGQMTIPRNSRFLVHMDDVEIINCDDGRGKHMLVYMPEKITSSGEE